MENSLQNSKSYIHIALLKYGHANFSLTILEYCKPEQCLEREDFYLSCFPHEYNILPKAGSSLGSKHSEESKQKISEAHKGKTLSDETRKKISDTCKKIDHSGRFKKGENNPNYGKPKAEGAGKSSQAIEVVDQKTNETTTYDSISEAARVLNIPQAVISMYFARNQQKPYKGQYTFKIIR
jgi:group I intron endonuclease